DSRITSETPLPAAVTDDDDRMRQLLAILFRRERTAQPSLYAHHIEVIARHHITAHVSIVAVMSHMELLEAIRDLSRKNFVPIRKVIVIRIREGVQLAALCFE